MHVLGTLSDPSRCSQGHGPASHPLDKAAPQLHPWPLWSEVEVTTAVLGAVTGRGASLPLGTSDHQEREF